MQDQELRTLLNGTPFERQVETLERAKMRRATDVLTRGAELNSLLKGLSCEELAQLRDLCGRLFLPVLETPITLPRPPLISWGAETGLDQFWGGGVQMGGIVEFSGAAGAGKSQIALWLAGRALAANPDAYVVYVSTEGGDFPVKRFSQMHEELGPRATDRILVERATSFDELWTVLQTRLRAALNRFQVALVVIDSVGALRSDYDFAASEDRSARTRHLWQLAQYLKFINDRYHCGVLVTNQMRADMQSKENVAFGSGDKVTPVLGLVWSNCVNTRIIVSKTTQMVDQGLVREMKVEMCPYLPRFSMPFVVTAGGLRAANGDGQ